MAFGAMLSRLDRRIIGLWLVARTKCKHQIMGRDATFGTLSRVVEERPLDTSAYCDSQNGGFTSAGLSRSSSGPWNM